MIEHGGVSEPESLLPNSAEPPAMLGGAYEAYLPSEAKAAPPSLPNGMSAAEVQALVERLRQLESAVTALQDTRQMEEHIVERVAEKVELRTAPSLREQASSIASMGRLLIPVATSMLRSPANDPAPAPLASSAPIPEAMRAPEDDGDAPPPPVAVFAATPQALPMAQPTMATRIRQSWLLVEAFAEMRLVLHMLFDRDYRVSWMVWLMPICALAFMLGSPFFPTIPVIGPLMFKPVELLLAYLAYKVVIREAIQYEQASGRRASKR